MKEEAFLEEANDPLWESVATQTLQRLSWAVPIRLFRR